MPSPRERPELPADMWLHVASDALARYVAGGGVVSIIADDGPGLCLCLPGVALNDPRLAPSFLALLAQNAPAPEEQPAP